MHKFEYELKMKSIIYIQIVIFLFIAGISMIYFGDHRIEIAAEKINGSTRIIQSEYLLRIFPRSSIEIYPAEKIRFYTYTDEDKSLQTVIIVTSGSNEHKLLQSRHIILDDSEKRNLYNDLSFFIQNDKKDNFHKNSTKTTKFGLLGYIISGICTLLLFSLIVNFINKTLVKRQLDKTVIKISNPIILLIKNDPERDLSALNTMDLSEVEKIVISCSKKESDKIRKTLKIKYEFLFTKESESTSEIIYNTLSLFQYKTGYLIFIQDLSGLYVYTVKDLLSDHKSKDSECTILTKTIQSRKFPAGKIIRNVVSKIIKITDKEESFESEETSAEIFQGVLCMNIEELNKYLSELNSKKVIDQTDISSAVECYFNKNKKVNSYHTKQNNGEKRESEYISSKPLLHKTLAALIISTSGFIAQKIETKIKSLIDNGIDSIGIIIHPDNRNNIGTIDGLKPEVIFSESGKGEAYELIIAKDWLKDLTGTVLIVPENSENISADFIKRLLTEHTSGGNTCTALKRTEGNFLVFCFSSVHLFKALDRINPHQKTSLSEIAEILKQQKRSVRIIEVNV